MSIPVPVSPTQHAANNKRHDGLQQYLTFALSGETYAIGILRIREIIQYAQLTEVPRMPAFIRGVINLRGAVVPVIDLSARFGKEPTALGRRNCIIIVEISSDSGSRSLGVMVDAVNAVLEIPDSDIEPAPALGSHIRTDFIDGMARINDRFVIVLDIQNVLSMNDIESLAAIASEPEQER